ncbi:hypothetical protein RI129_012853 [Pyrocoelia pectoralis]|uniref:Protein DP71L n=1 Tax=Pyrocoelia pectoralis TaxID=417401 RepID=A0AAN7ZGK0_9COLE
MYKLQSNGAFHMSNRIGLGYDNMQLKPDYHDNRHFSLINNLDMKEFNTCKTFDYVKKPHVQPPMSYSTKPSCVNSLSNYRVHREEIPPKLEMTVEDHQAEQAANSCRPPDQNGKSQQKSRKRKRNRKRRRRNQNRKNKTDISSPLITQFCAITIEPSDTVDGCCSPSSFVRPNSATVPLIRTCRTRLPSDCESEDSFIIFGDENVPVSMYPQCKTRLQSDCISEDSFIVFDGGDQSDCDDFIFDSSSDDQLPRKKVRFASEENLCEIHPMIQWSYAYQKARKGPWEQFALDRMRFRNRVVNVQPILGPILEPSHRNKIYKERFEGSGLD